MKRTIAWLSITGLLLSLSLLPLLPTSYARRSKTPATAVAASSASATAPGQVSAKRSLLDSPVKSEAPEGDEGQTAYGVTANGTLFRFRTEIPATVTTIGNLGIIPEAIDFRPGSSILYAIDVGPTTTQLYTINVNTAAITPVGDGFPSSAGEPVPYSLSEAFIGFDFNPTTLQADNSMRIRVVATGGTNLRLNSSTGEISDIDTPVNYPDSKMVPGIDAVAYINNAVPTMGGTTTLYDMDFFQDDLVTQIPPNSGTLNTVGPFGVDINAIAGIGFDIFSLTDSDATNDDDLGFAVFRRPNEGGDARNVGDDREGGGGDGPYLLYDVNLDTGATTNGRLVGGGLDFLGGFAVLPVVAGVDITKLTNGTNNNVAPGPNVTIGSNVTFTYIVDNVNTEALQNVLVRDDNGTPVNMADDFNATFVGGDTNGNGLLDATETWTFTANRIATAGQYTNVGTVTASGAASALQVTDSDVDNHFGANVNVTISINDVSQAEGNTGAGTFTPFVFTVSLSAASGQTVTVDFKTANGTAFAAEDFLPESGTLTFNPGELNKNVIVLVNAELLEIIDETFFVNLSNPTNATISDGQGLGTILDDDATGTEPPPPNAFAITGTNQLLSFNIAVPEVILSRTPITGLVFGETVLAIDFRPANGQLYGFTSYNRLVTINTTSGAINVIASIPGLVGDEYGIDFNPTNDRLRIVNNRDQNYSINPDDGTATPQTPLNPGDPNIGGIAYTNNFAGAATTTLYAVDFGTDTLNIINPPASGTVSPVGPLQATTNSIVGFDIAPVSNVGYVSLSGLLDNAATLYALELTTGEAHLVGTIGSEPTNILDISVSTIPPPNIVGLTTGNNLVFFNSLTPGSVTATIPITGLAFGETVIGIDYRPASGQLYGYTSYNRVVRIDNPQTGVPTVLGTPTNLAGNEYGFDFNPVPDRIRVVNDTDQNIRVNPNDGSLAGNDTPLAYAPGDPNTGQNPTVTGVAYTNNFAGTTSTTLFGIDADRDILVRQGSPNGSPTSPNTGQLFTIGSLGVDTSPLVGFDIAAGTGAAYAALQPSLGGFSSLYTINLVTGRATLIGVIGGTQAIRDIAIAPAGVFDFVTPQPTTVAENAGVIALSVQRGGDTAIATSVNYATTDGTALAGSDYTATSGTLFFNPGETSKIITIPIIDNATAEPGETFTVTLSNPTGGNFIGAFGIVTVTINDND